MSLPTPIAYWKLDGNSTDAVAGTYTGTDTDITYVSGLIGNCASFNGSTSQIATPVIPLTNTTFSISLWFKTATLNNYNFFAQGNTSDNNPIISLGMTNTGNNLEVVNRDNSAVGLVATPACTVTLNTWHNVTWVCTTTNSDLYYDGSLLNTTTFTANTGTFNTQRIGVRRRIVDDSPMNGQHEEMCVFPSALTAVNVSEIWNGGAGITYPFPSAAVTNASFLLFLD